jgi:hypothetical protein
LGFARSLRETPLQRFHSIIIGVLLRLSQHHRDGAHRAPDVFIARLPVADTYPHRPHATPGSRREERFAGCRDGGDYVIGPVVVIRAMRIEKAHQSLVNRRAPKHFGTRESSDAIDDGTRVITTAFNQRGNAIPA